MTESSRTELYKVACTHPSYVNENGGEHNEKLEFLGDSVLQLCVTELLVKELPEFNEGQLSQARHALVNNRILAEIAHDIGLDQLLRVGRGVQSIGEQMLANCFEAMLGALYLEQGLSTCKMVVGAHLKHRFKEALRVPAKRRLQEWTQKTYKIVPKYAVVEVSGPDHNRLYHVSVSINDEVIAYGRASKKQEATFAAAENAVKALGLV